MNKETRIKELCEIYLGKPSASLSDLVRAEKAASGYAWTLNESQPVSDEQLSADIDEMRSILKEQSK